MYDIFIVDTTVLLNGFVFGLVVGAYICIFILPISEWLRFANNRMEVFKIQYNRRRRRERRRNGKSNIE